MTRTSLLPVATAMLLVLLASHAAADVPASLAHRTSLAAFSYVPFVSRNWPLPPTPSPTASPTPTATPRPGWITFVNDSFEGPFPAPWTVFADQSALSAYTWGKRNCLSFEGNHSAWAVGGGANGAALSCGTNYPSNVKTWMVYGPFSLVGGYGQFRLQLRLDTVYPDGFSQMASTNGVDFYGIKSSGGISNWVERSLDLGSLTGQPRVWVALVFESDGQESRPGGVYVDNVVLRQCWGGACGFGAPLGADSGPTPGVQGFTETPVHMVLMP
jgi:hypothetical protein